MEINELERSLSERNVYETLNQINYEIKLNKPLALVHRWANIAGLLGSYQKNIGKSFEGWSKENSFSSLKNNFKPYYDKVILQIKKAVDNKFIRI